MEPSSPPHKHSENNDSNNPSPSNMYTSLPSNSVKISSYAWKVLAVLSCIATMVMYAETMLIPAIPDLIKYFHVSYSMSSWILTAYLVSGAVMTPIAGKLSDIYGRKKILLIIMVIYAVGVSLSGFAANIYFMLIARAIQGIGMSMFPIAFGIVRDQFPREKISIGQGIITSMFASGAVIGLAVGGIIVQNYGWRATFFTIIPIAIALLLIIRRFINVDDGGDQQQQQGQKQSQIVEDKNIRETKRKNNENIIDKKSANQIDIKGAITLATMVTSFLLVLTFIETSDNNTNSSTQILVPFLLLGIVSFVLFVVIEKRAKHPLVDFKLMLNKSILPANLIIMLVGLSMFMIFQTIPILIRNPGPIGFGEDAINTGKVQLPFAIILLIFGPTSGFIISKLGSLKPIILGAFITAAAFIGLLLFHSTELLVSINLAILSTGLSLTSVGAMNVIILSTPRQFTGVSLGMSTLMRIIGSAVGPALAGMYMQTHQSLLHINGIAQYFPSPGSFNLIFFSAVVLSVGSIVLAIILRQRVLKMAIPNLA
ncbi:MAG: MFS transporter [Nitrososphaeraceae archaeon]|nr:MFS transporter [Nitrososphaeraceae archaeon]MBV9668273.1 MFS transporter [Nitrososphaeraceae archaeon]